MRIPPALHHRRYLYLWLGMLISLAGSQMQWAALHWHIRILTDEPNPMALGGIGLARIVPVIVFSFLGGPVADTFNRRRVLFITQTVMILVAVALFLLTLAEKISIGTIYLLTAIQAAAQAFDSPARQAMIPSLVPVKELPNAFSMSSIAQNTGAILGPALAGVVIAMLGQEYAYLFNAFSFLAVIIALIAMGPVHQDTSNSPGINLTAAIDGFRFIFSRKIILSTMITDFVATFFASAKTMMPIVAKDILKVNEIGYGWLSSAESIGSVLAGLFLSQFRMIQKQGKVFLAAVTAFGLATILFGMSYRIGIGTILFNLPGLSITVAFLVAFTALILSGAADAVSTIIRNTIRQLNTPDHIRGRMVSVNQIFFQGGPQLGEVESGILASLVGVPATIVFGGIGCLVGIGIISLKWPELTRYNGNEHLYQSQASQASGVNTG